MGVIPVSCLKQLQRYSGDLWNTSPSQVSERVQWALQERVRESETYETYEHLPEVIRKDKQLAWSIEVSVTV